MGNKPRRGRPPKNESEQRRNRVCMMLTDAKLDEVSDYLGGLASALPMGIATRQALMEFIRG